MNIVYLVFGDNTDHYQQVYFSIYTAMIHKNSDHRIIVVAENASLFHSLRDHIEVISIDRETIKQWEGVHEFFWRVKIKALQLVAERYPAQSILYLDGDTFFFNSTDVLWQRMEDGQNFMHVEEGKLASLTSKTERKMWAQMKGKTYADIKIDQNSSMWNAGVIGIAKDHLDCLHLTLNINDAMCADGVTRRLIEQFAFSLGLHAYAPLQPADDIVGHYWGNKNFWNSFISSFLKECFMKDYSLAQILEKVKQHNLTEHPIRVRESSTRRKLHSLINQLFKNNKPVYIK